MKNSTKKSLISVAIVLVLVLALTCVLVACGGKPTAPNTEPKAASFVNIDVNPSLELVLDENNMVLDVQAANEDAEILIHGEKGNGIIGNSLDIAVKNIGRLSVEMGYVSEDNNHINISVVGESDINVDEIKKSVKASLEAGVKESASIAGQAAANLQCVVEDGIDLAYKYELEAIREKYNLTEEQLDLPRYRLIRSAMLHKVGLTFTKALNLTNGQLAEIVANGKQDVKGHMTQAQINAVREAELAFENAKTVTKDLAYIASLDVNINQLTEFGAASNYVANHIYELCMKQAYDIYKVSMYEIDYSDKEANDIADLLYPNAEQANAKAAFLQATKNDEGKYTKASVMQYVNKQYRNMVTEEKAQFDTAYADAKAKINAGILEKDHSISASIKFNNFTADFNANFGLSEGTVKKLNDIMDGMKTILDNLTPNKKGLSADERFEKQIANAENRTVNAKEIMLKALSEEQIKEAQQKEVTYENFINTKREEYNQARAQFNTAADEWLKAAQKARLEQYEANQAK